DEDSCMGAGYGADDRGTGALLPLRSRDSADPRGLLVPGAVPSGTARRPAAGGRSVEYGNTSAAGACAGSNPRDFRAPSRTRSARIAHEHVPGGEPLFPNYANAHREYMAAR